MATTRRDVLKVAALAGLSSACGGQSPVVPSGPGEPMPGPAPTADATATARVQRQTAAEPAALALSTGFPLGISSGDVAGERAVVQCRYVGSAPLQLRVWKEAGGAWLEQGVTVADGGFVHVDLEGLAADTYYSYMFVELTTPPRRSGIGRFRSARAPGALGPLVLGAISCTSQTRSLAALEHAIARTDLDAFLLLGDTTYADGANDAASYRAKWAASLSRREYRALREQVPLIATWDDHEVDNDWNPELTSAAKLDAARAAFFEHLPVRRDVNEPNRVWRSVRFGATAEVFVLDGRSERRPSTILSSDPQYLSPRQVTWLKGALSASPCMFKVIMNSVPISQFPFSPFNPDGWSLYAAQRKELLEHIDANVTGVLWVSGDHHFASVGRVAPSGPGKDQLEALAGPGAQDSNVLWQACTGAQFDWASGDNNYLAIHLDPATRGLRLKFWGREGQKLQDQQYTL